MDNNLPPVSDQTKVDDARRVSDHLANERTYLAWVRTGVSMMGLGIVIAKLRYLMPFAPTPQSNGVLHAAHIGIFFAAIGVITVIFAVLLFLQTQKQIRTGTYRSQRGFVLGLASLTVLLGGAILWYLL